MYIINSLQLAENKYQCISVINSFCNGHLLAKYVYLRIILYLDCIGISIPEQFLLPSLRHFLNDIEAKRRLVLRNGVGR